MRKLYHVHLTEEERAQLQHRIASGKGAARQLAHARILLKADEAQGGPALPDEAIASAVEVGIRTVERVRKLCVEEGVERALVGRARRAPAPRKLDGRREAQLIALACSTPPAGRKRWTLRLLADRMVELEYVDDLSYETVRRTLKKTPSSPGVPSGGASRPRQTPNSWPRWRYPERLLPAL